MKMIALSLVLAAPFASAHITIDPASAAAGAHQKLTFRVGHGCAGSATSGITVQLPEGLEVAKPMPKAGWTIVASPREISWFGGPLLDAWYDEFNIQVKLPATTGKLAFKVVQQCEKGKIEWTEVGTVGKQPAPMLEVLPATGGHAH